MGGWGPERNWERENYNQNIVHENNNEATRMKPMNSTPSWSASVLALSSCLDFSQ